MHVSKIDIGTHFPVYEKVVMSFEGGVLTNAIHHLIKGRKKASTSCFGSSV